MDRGDAPPSPARRSGGPGGHWWAIFRFEVRYHLGQPLFYLVTFFLGVLLFTWGTGHASGSAAGAIHLNAPGRILETLLKAIHLPLFLVIALVASTALRDFERGTEGLFLSKPVSRFDHLTGRFAGAIAVGALACFAGVGALAASSFMPGLDPERVGPFRPAPYAFGLGVLLLPTLFAVGGVLHALATWTRSTLATWLGIVAFFAVSTVAAAAAVRLDARWVGELLDPSGLTALAGTLRYWTVAELNTTTPRVEGMLLWNRLFWLALGIAALGLSVRTFDPSRQGWIAKGWRRGVAGRWGRGPGGTAGGGTAEGRTAEGRTPRPAAHPHPVRLQFLHQLRHETATLLVSFWFPAILAVGLLVLVQGAASAGNLFGMPVHPRTHLMLEALQGGYSIVLLLVVVLYSGELIWRERSLELDGVHDSMPTPSGVYLGARLGALVLAILAFLGVGVVALMGFQLLQGYTHLEPGLYARGMAIAAVYPVLMAVLACFLHIVAPGRIAGYGLVILFIVSWDLLEEIGFEHHLHRFAGLPPTPYSDLSGYGPFLAPFGWYTLYWGLAAVVLIGLSTLFWKRGSDQGWRARLGAARRRFRGPVRGVLAAGTVGFLTTGAWIFHNTNVLNAYVPGTVAAERAATYERQYRQYHDLDLPRIIAVRADVDIFPDEGRVALRGGYRLRNGTEGPLRDLHLSIPDGVRLEGLHLPAHERVVEDSALGYHIYRLREPLAPGAEIALDFELALGDRGFVNHDPQTAIVGNGSYFTRRDLFPVIGYDEHRQLTDPDARRRQGLEPLGDLPPRDDLRARRNTPRASDADRVDFETTVSTGLDQVAVTSGELQREWVQEGRRYFHYRAEAPITHHFAYTSARYEVARSRWNDVTIEIYHHPGHGENVARMIEAVQRSLEYFTTHFGAYQHRHLRIVEFPRYQRDATSFPGMITFSEALGFNARLRDDAAVDFPFYITAHEVAHQWWGQQVVAAHVQGAGMLHETLAQYSALLVMEEEVGPERLRSVLEYEREWYLRGRAGERGVEPPIARAGRQDYVYYHKGALAMYTLREAVGEEALNQALKRYLDRVAFQGPPYTTTAELLEELRSIMRPGPAGPPGREGLVDELFDSPTN